MKTEGKFTEENKAYESMQGPVERSQESYWYPQQKRWFKNEDEKSQDHNILAVQYAEEKSVLGHEDKKTLGENNEETNTDQTPQQTNQSQNLNKLAASKETGRKSQERQQETLETLELTEDNTRQLPLEESTKKQRRTDENLYRQEAKNPKSLQTLVSDQLSQLRNEYELKKQRETIKRDAILKAQRLLDKEESYSRPRRSIHDKMNKHLLEETKKTEGNVKGFEGDENLGTDEEIPVDKKKRESNIIHFINLSEELEDDLGKTEQRMSGNGQGKDKAYSSQEQQDKRTDIGGKPRREEKNKEIVNKRNKNNLVGKDLTKKEHNETTEQKRKTQDKEIKKTKSKLIQKLLKMKKRLKTIPNDLHIMSQVENDKNMAEDLTEKGNEVRNEKINSSKNVTPTHPVKTSHERILKTEQEGELNEVKHIKTHQMKTSDGKKMKSEQVKRLNNKTQRRAQAKPGIQKKLSKNLAERETKIEHDVKHFKTHLTKASEEKVKPKQAKRIHNKTSPQDQQSRLEIYTKWWNNPSQTNLLILPTNGQKNVIQTSSDHHLLMKLEAMRYGFAERHDHCPTLVIFGTGSEDCHTFTAHTNNCAEDLKEVKDMFQQSCVGTKFYVYVREHKRGKSWEKSVHRLSKNGIGVLTLK